MNFRRQRKENLEINITPMIDVVFLLLIFFMVTTTFNRETELQIQLPEAQGNEPVVKKVVEVTIGASGTYFVNNEQVINTEIATLKKAISDAAGNQVKLPLVIAADAKSPHQSMISVLEAAGDLGFVHITFAAKTSPKKGD